MYTITLNDATVDRIEDGLISALVCLRHDQTAIELGNFSRTCQALGALRAARDLTRVPVDDSTPLEVLALSPPPLSGDAPFEPTEEDWDDYRAHSPAADPADWADDALVVAHA